MTADAFRQALAAAGAVAVGFIEAEEASPRDMRRLEHWLADGHAAGMDYMRNHLDLRRDPRSLLAEARTIICTAFPYSPHRLRDKSLSRISVYAYGKDYHDVIRKRVRKALSGLRERFGGEYRICIDSAPVLERYWAQKSGIGERCDNGLVFVPGHGTRVFLCEILTTLDIAGNNDVADAADAGGCLHCGACSRSCPAGALQPDGTVDARLCLSYLTIEHRGDWDNTGRRAMLTPEGRKTLFGCDICQDVCPLNRNVPPTAIEEFYPSGTLLTLDAADLRDIDADRFSELFRGSPIKRTGAAGISRNARNIVGSEGEKPSE